MANIYLTGEVGWDITVSSVLESLEALKDEIDITLYIHSPGGSVYEGNAIYDLLMNSGKRISTVGLFVGSIATKLFLIPPIERRNLTELANFYIHNPSGGAFGEADEIIQQGEEVKKIENEIADFYAEKTGLNRESMLELMKPGTMIAAEDAVKLGFAGAVLKPVMNNFLSPSSMSNKKEGNVLQQIKNLLGGKDSPQNETFALQDGKEISIDLQGKNYPATGMTANWKDSHKRVEAGTYALADKNELVIGADGKIEEVMRFVDAIPTNKVNEYMLNAVAPLNEVIAQAKADFAAQITAYKSENETLQAKITNLETKLGENAEVLNGLKAIASGYTPKADPQNNLAGADSFDAKAYADEKLRKEWEAANKQQ